MAPSGTLHASSPVLTSMATSASVGPAPSTRAAPAIDGSTAEYQLDVEAITQVMAESRDPKRLLQVWEGWHTISPPMRPDYARFVDLSNKGARELGFQDTGANCACPESSDRACVPAAA